ncbi:helix-turn-helix domain-containing protein [Burkholderia humptydooensis]|uniref:Helix-turn-helix domain-containing protein n=1 Tax=Burkholderia humptydooensis TaxID=430531 RepID=A0A7T2WXV4_9BURK|nr:prophage CP4-57 regulatory family protein [Burkholderia sp. 2002721687]QPS43390.1 helix-turn-helix domain-containing protein [Burkholderia humptydooensis]HDR9269801.1 helix-turn-helix domain-containing protein [Burkholderia vietnamiensis]
MTSHHESFTPLTKQAVADVLGISVRSVENWINDGTLPAPVKLGNRVYWHPDVFFGWLSRRLLEPVAEWTGERVAPAHRPPKPVTKLPESVAAGLRASTDKKLARLQGEC